MLSPGRLLLLAAASIPLITASHDTRLQVFLHPSPNRPSHLPPPTLTANQAKAVLNHHLGDEIGDFEEIPGDEGLWGSLMGLWRHETGDRGRVVVIEGGVESQGWFGNPNLPSSLRWPRLWRGSCIVEVLPAHLPHQPTFYLEDDESAWSLIDPYLSRAKHFFDSILEQLPQLAKDFKSIFDLAGTSGSFLSDGFCN